MVARITSTVLGRDLGVVECITVSHRGWLTWANVANARSVLDSGRARNPLPTPAARGRIVLPRATRPIRQAPRRPSFGALEAMKWGCTPRILPRALCKKEFPALT